MTVQTPSRADRVGRLESIDRFVAYVERICRTEPGTRAGLRRGVGHHPDTAFRSHAVVASWVGPDTGVAARADAAREWAYYAVAAMIATQPGRARTADDQDGDISGAAGDAVKAVPPVRYRSNLGASLAQAVSRNSSGDRVIAHESAEKRLHLLTRQGLAGVHRHLPVTVRHLRAAGVPIDWSVLIDDLSRWSTSRDRVTKEWLQAFYQSVQPSTSDNTTPGSAAS